MTSLAQKALGIDREAIMTWCISSLKLNRDQQGGLRVEWLLLSIALLIVMEIIG